MNCPALGPAATQDESNRLWAVARLAAEVSDWKRDSETLVQWAERTLKPRQPSNLKRYRIVETGDGVDLRADPNGAYVLYSEVAAMLAR